jgi:hypothetical protein
MHLVLTDFMQTVSLKDLTSAKSFLVFANEAGEELRVPVGPEAIEALTRFALAREEAPSQPPIVVPGQEEPPEYPGGTHPGGTQEDGENLDEDLDAGLDEDIDATTFGGDVEDGDDDPDPARPFELPKVPRSEEEIKSL